MTHYDFEGEPRINKIGGRLQDEYLTFKSSVHFVNDNYIPLFLMMGFNQPDDKDIIIDALLNDSPFMHTARSAFISMMEEKISTGKVKLERLLSQNAMNKQLKLAADERQKFLDREIHRSLCSRFKEIYNEYYDNYDPSPFGFYKLPFKICRECLVLGTNGFEIDVNKFIGIYQSYIEADQSIIKGLQQSAADAVNIFFGGSVPVSWEELQRYFTIDAGILVPNPQSINMESYMRLGIRERKACKRKVRK